MFTPVLGLLFLQAALPVALAQVNSSSLFNVTNAFGNSQVVPDVLSFFTPSSLLVVEFQNVEVTPGIFLTMNQTASAPDLTIETVSDAEVANATFALAMVDPDAPLGSANNSLAQFRHFLGGNFKADPKTKKLTNSSAALTDYAQPSPPDGSVPHRYVWLVYNTTGIDFSSASSTVNPSTPRNNFNISNFASGLGLGNPIAGTYFNTGPKAFVIPKPGAAASSTGTTLTRSGSGSLPSSTAPASSQAPASTSAAPSAAGRIEFPSELIILAVNTVFAGTYILW